MREYLLTLCVTAAVTYLLTGPVRKFAIAAGAMPQIRARDVHREPTPRLGGIAMFGGLCAGLLVASQLTNIGELFVLSDEPRALLSGAGLIWLLGVLDDKWGVDALVKLGGQMIAAGVMVLQGLTILWLPVPGVGNVALTQLQGTLLTVALVVITINAVNFVDGLDGLASGMVTIAAAAFFMYAYRIWYGYGIEAAAPATLFAAVLMGMCLGFLPHNMHPARIFMGDSGSMLIGLVLAAGAVSITGQVDPDLVVEHTRSVRAAVHQMVPLYMPLLLPLTIIAIPVADLVLAIVRRTWRGESPFAADKGHLHHRLLEIGHSHSRAVLIMYFWSALIAFGAVAFSVQSASMVIVLAVVVLCAIGLVVLLMPRFTPRVPGWAHAFVPPRYRQKIESASPPDEGNVQLSEEGPESADLKLESESGKAESGAESEAAAAAEAEGAEAETAEAGAGKGPRQPQPAFAGLNGATALGGNRQQGTRSSEPSCDGQHTK
ncbi:UDP-GlcNAc:undecaprenyl-phosphate GlcNAc-1-phosphate transferase [Streptomyces sp. WMMB 714]|uniref:MraY family glycosyltransferase n=1 Tax=Streptomyces sp. WMMB 714 TaxID=1286822 RepID=UPI0005F7D178|nr:MraY family glycosyltransferase [Streptomyces sp. WMMB 714]SCK11245.1 UDP-GlcNAc:undecaprenyl-phosphate GlcNAc-1-phosphate transferase [Streptomyces sp. WMMB 714]